MRQGQKSFEKLFALLILAVGLFFSVAATRVIAAEEVVRLIYFYAVDCEHCRVVEAEVLEPLSEEYGAQLEIAYLEIGDPDNYEFLIQAEDKFAVSAEERGIPTLIIGEQVLIGEDSIRDQLESLIEAAVGQGGLGWPDIPGLQVENLDSDQLTLETGEESAGVCVGDEDAACSAPTPVWAAYFYQVGCQECSRAEADIQYIRALHPQLTIEEFNIYDDAALAQWLAERAGRVEDLYTPALFIGAEMLIGPEEITPQNLTMLIERYSEDGAPRIWRDFDPDTMEQGLIERFRSFGPLTVVFAGLVDGLNPCAFATLIFFVSYLTLSGRKGRDALMVGAAFTLGVFLAYLVIGLGFYKVLDMLGNLLTVLRQWVYGLTAVGCLVLAVFSFLDFLKAHRGDIGDMSLNLPHTLRMRINAVIRKGRHARAFVIGAFFTGIIISFLELACTGQVYLPTIIFLSGVSELRGRAVGYLVLYNLLFILPLVVVFVMAYYGTTSKDLTLFLQRRAAWVKLSMTALFSSLGVWLVLMI